jgi:hypothetical protein
MHSLSIKRYKRLDGYLAQRFGTVTSLDGKGLILREEVRSLLTVHMGLHAQQAADLLLAIEREHPQCMQEVSMYHDDHSRSRSSAAAAIEGDGGGGGGGGGGHTYRELERGRERWGAVQQCARGGRNALIPFIMQLLTTILVASDRIAKIDAAAGTWEPVVHLAISADGTVEVDLLICELEVALGRSIRWSLRRTPLSSSR